MKSSKSFGQTKCSGSLTVIDDLTKILVVELSEVYLSLSSNCSI